MAYHIISALGHGSRIYPVRIQTPNLSQAVVAHTVKFLATPASTVKNWVSKIQADLIAYDKREKLEARKLELGRLKMKETTSAGKFNAIFPLLVEQISNHVQRYKIPQAHLEHFKKSLEINSLGGKCNRGIAVIDSASLLLGNDLSETQYFETATLGWLIELLQAFFLVSDDIMDSSITRRGKPCWYRQPGVGMVAINDAFLLESSIYVLLKSHFKRHLAYVDMVELFHEVSIKTEVGQLSDLLTAPEDHVNLDNFSPDKYRFIVIYKTAYYSFYLPVALALHYLNIATPRNLSQAEEILIPMGEYFQIQDDYLDNFGDPDHIGKVGTDIQDNKCSWLVNQALKIVNPAQREILDKHYGRKSRQDEAKIKALYQELKLKQIYLDYEEKQVAEIQKLIDQVDESEGLKKSVFEAFLKKIHKRSK